MVKAFFVSVLPALLGVLIGILIGTRITSQQAQPTQVPTSTVHSVQPTITSTVLPTINVGATEMILSATMTASSEIFATYVGQNNGVLWVCKGTNRADKKDLLDRTGGLVHKQLSYGDEVYIWMKGEELSSPFRSYYGVSLKSEGSVQTFYVLSYSIETNIGCVDNLKVDNFQLTNYPTPQPQIHVG